MFHEYTFSSTNLEKRSIGGVKRERERERERDRERECLCVHMCGCGCVSVSVETNSLKYYQEIISSSTMNFNFAYYL